MTCPKCDGTGWLVGPRGADRCSCAAKTGRQPTPEEVSEAVDRMAQMIPFFPASTEACAFIAERLSGRVQSKAHLDRFVANACERIEKWDGLAGLLKVLESGSGEQGYFEREAAETNRKLADWKRDFKARGELPAPESLQLEGACEMPKPADPIKPAPDDRPVLNRVPDDPQQAHEAAERLKDVMSPANQKAQAITQEDIRKAEEELRNRRPKQWAEYADSDKAALEREWERMLKRGRLGVS